MDSISAQIGPFVNSADPSSLFRYVRQKEKAIERLSLVAEKPDLVEKLDKPLSCLTKDPDFEDLTVLAHLSGRINDIQLGTAFYWRSVFKRHEDHPVHEIPLFLEDMTVNHIAQLIMNQTVKQTNPLSPYSKNILTEEQVNLWFENMRLQPSSEQRFLIATPISDGTDAIVTMNNSAILLLMPKKNAELQRKIFGNCTDPDQSTLPTIMDAVYQEGQCNLFNRVTYNNETHRIFPSIGMAATLFKMVGGNATLTLRFGAGQNLRENGLNGERDVVVRNPYQLTPKRADFYRAPGDEYTSHDLCFHSYLANLVPREHQKLFIELGDFLAPTHPFFADRCYDMECHSYRNRSATTNTVMHTFSRHCFLGWSRKNISTHVLPILQNPATSDEEKEDLLVQHFQTIFTITKELQPLEVSIITLVHSYLSEKTDKTPFEIEIEKLCTERLTYLKTASFIEHLLYIISP